MATHGRSGHRNVQSPAPAKQGPMKATLPVGSLMRGGAGQVSPTRRKPSPPIKWSDRHSPAAKGKPASGTQQQASGLQKEKSKTLNLKSVSASPFIRRTASLDAIYLAGQWPRDLYYLGYCGQLMLDKATQTPDEWEETDRKRSAQKKNSVSSSDQLEMKFIRQRLQRTNQSSRGTGGSSSSHQRHSPVQGDHSAISSSNGGSGGAPSALPASSTSPSSPSTPPAAGSSPHPCNAAHGTVPRTVPIPIPHIPKPLIPRMRNSVEGLNQEIERLVLKGISGIEGEAEQERVSMPVLEPTPDGHRAPIAELFRATRRSVNTQTPSGGRGGSGDSCPSSGTASRSQSISPVVPIIPGPMDSSRPPSMEDAKSASPDMECSGTKLGASPQLNKFLTREPPDGCEKVKIVEEARKPSGLVEAGDYCPPKPSMNFVLKPSQSSAFCPLHKGQADDGDDPEAAPSSSDATQVPSASSPVDRLTQQQ